MTLLSSPRRMRCLFPLIRTNNVYLTWSRCTETKFVATILTALSSHRCSHCNTVIDCWNRQISCRPIINRVTDNASWQDNSGTTDEQFSFISWMLVEICHPFYLRKCGIEISSQRVTMDWRTLVLTLWYFDVEAHRLWDGIQILVHRYELLKSR